MAVRQCECGCGSTVRNRFLPGHDARLRSQLINQAIEARNGRSRESARKRLDKLGWTHFLRKAEEIRDLRSA